MVTEKRDRPDEDERERGIPESLSGGEDTEEAMPANDESADGPAALGDQPEAAGFSGGIAPDQGGSTPNPPLPAANHEMGGLAEPPRSDLPFEPPPLPPPAPASLAANSLTTSSADPPGIAFNVFRHDAGADERSAHDLLLRNDGSSSGHLQRLSISGPDPAEAMESPPQEARGHAGDSAAGAPVVRQLPPMVIPTGSGERRVEKRLEIEVEVTVANAERMGQIASNKTMMTFARLAEDAVFKVADDLHTFRESYRREWGR